MFVQIEVNGKPLLVREDGLCKNVSGWLRPGTVDPREGKSISVGGRSVKLFRLVAMAHVPNPSGYGYVKFSDGNKANIHADNLYWSNTPYDKESWDAGRSAMYRRLAAK